MKPEDEIEKSLELCNDLQSFIKKQEVKKPVNNVSWDEINAIINGKHDDEKSEEELIIDDPIIQESIVEKPVIEESIIEEPVIDEPVDEKKLVTDEIKKLESDDEEQPKKHIIIEIFQGILNLVICVAIAIIVSFLITKYVAHHTRVDGTSMAPSLHDNDQIIVEEVSYYFHEPERFDIIVFPYAQGIYYIKRVIGLPNETIQIHDGKIYIDGTQLIENYGSEEIQDPGLAAEEIKLGKDEYFVLGDNRNASVDSRKVDVGVVHRKDIAGRAWLRFYPFSDFEFIKHS